MNATRSGVYLHILGTGKTKAAVAQSKGRLFEQLVSDLLAHLKIHVTHMNKSETGTEIDIEGESVVGGLRVFAECKAQQDSLDSTDIQKFGFKFYTKKDEISDVRGILFSLSGLNPKAQEVWHHSLVGKHGSQVSCYLHDQIVELLIDHYRMAAPQVIQGVASSEYQRNCGDTQIICLGDSDGSPLLVYAQLLMSSDESEPSQVAFYTKAGSLLADAQAVQRVLQAKPDLATPRLTCVNLRSQNRDLASADEVSPGRSVVRVRMSSGWFDYRFPAAPQFFVGRGDELEALSAFIASVREGTTSTRGVLVTGRSGIGKSSLALKAQSLLRCQNVLLLPIDCRLCDDVSFLFDAVNELLFELRQLPELDSALGGIRVSGIDSLIGTLTDVSKVLTANGWLAALFFDQFEKVFEHPEVAGALRALHMRIGERRLSVLFGFAWKSDLWSLAEGFPHAERDDIVRESIAIRQLRQFGQNETAEILRQLETAWGSKLGAVLHQQLAAFSRGPLATQEGLLSRSGTERSGSHGKRTDRDEP